LKGKFHTEESKKAISIKMIGNHWHKGKPLSEEHKLKDSIAIKKWWEKRKNILNNNKGETYGSG